MQRYCQKKNEFNRCIANCNITNYNTLLIVVYINYKMYIESIS